MFASLLKDYGPLDPNDRVIQQQLEKCSTDAQVAICEAGGIGKFLHQSIQFTVVDGFVCLLSDAGKARQLARSLAELPTQQPPVKLNPPPNAARNPTPATHYNSATTNMPVSSYHSLDGINFSPSSSGVIATLSENSVSAWSGVPTFLSQPSASRGMHPPDLITSSATQTAVGNNNNYNGNGIKLVNDAKSYDTSLTYSTVTKPTSGPITMSGAIGELDDFSEELYMAENSNAASQQRLSKATDNTKNVQQSYYSQYKDIPGTSESETSDESSEGDSDGSSSDLESVDDTEDVQSNGAGMVRPGQLLMDISSANESFHSARPAADIDLFDAEVAGACAAQSELASMMLSANAPVFVPHVLAASQPSRVSKSSPQVTTSSRASSHSRPGSSAAAAAVMSDKRVQTDESWSDELQQMKHSHALELAGLQQQLAHSVSQLQVSSVYSYRQ